MKEQGFVCGDCACFHHDLSAVSPDFPAQSGCIEVFLSMRTPRDMRTATPNHINQFGVHFTEADTSAAGCADFTREGGAE